MAATKTIQQTVNYCTTLAELMPLSGVGGYVNEPALTLANNTLQKLLAQPYAWKFNRVEPAVLVPRPYHQDMLWAGASAWTAEDGGIGIQLASASGITQSSFTVTVTTLEDHPFVTGRTVYMTGNGVAAYNSTFTQGPTSSGWSGGWTIASTPTARTFTFVHASSGLGTSGASGITDFGWLESASFTDTRDTASTPYVFPMRAVRNIAPSSDAGVMKKVCAWNTSTAGVLKVRFYPYPGLVPYAVALVYQAKAPLKTALTNTWSPFPDEYGFVYQQEFVAQAYDYIDSRKAPSAAVKAKEAAMLALGHDDSEDADESISPEEGLMGE